MADCGQLALVDELAREELALIPDERKQDWPYHGCTALEGAALAAQRKFAEAEPWLLHGTEGVVRQAGRLPHGGKSL